MSAGGVHVEQVQHWLAALPPILVYLVVGGVVGTESLGVPVPGEIALVAASLLAATGHTNVWWVALGASAGAIVGDSIGYALGRRGGRAMLERFGRRFPKHFGPAHLAKAEKMFGRWGVWTVFFGRFIALLRILGRQRLRRDPVGVGHRVRDLGTGPGRGALVVGLLLGGPGRRGGRRRDHHAGHPPPDAQGAARGVREGECRGWLG